MADLIHKGVIEIAVDGSAVTAGIEKAKAQLKGLEGGVTQAGKATDGLDAVSRRYLTTLEREALQAGKTRSEYHALKLAKLEALNPGITAKADPFLQQLRDAEKAVVRTGMSAKQTAAAMRQVPSQMTDIIVSLQSGQNPLTVLLQQGGQLKDVFGGVVPAARALGGAVLGLVNPFTLVAGAAAAAGVAYFQGSKEADNYAAALIMTGNAAGVTADRLQMMAAGISTVVGTQSGAAEAVTQIAAAGNIASENIERFAQTAVQAERLTGTAVAETVKTFAELGRAPVDASLKLNQTTRYLTLSVLDQIKALESQGRASEAASLAQRTYDDAMVSRLGKLEDRLGFIQRLWRDITDDAKKGWDVMLNIGRPQTGADRLAELRAELSKREARGPMFADTGAAFEKGNQRLREQIALLQSGQSAADKAAAAEGERVRATEAAVKAEGEIERIRKESATNQEKLNKALSDYRRNIDDIRKADPASAFLDPKLIARDEANIRERFRDKRTPNTARGEDRSLLAFDLSKIKGDLDAVTGAFRNAETILEAVRTAGLVSEREYNESKIAFIRLNAEAQTRALDEENARIAQEKVNTKDRIDNDRKIAENKAKSAAIRANATTQIEALTIREQASQEALARSYIESQRAADAYLQSLTPRQDRTLQGVGQGDTKRGFNAGLNDIEDRFAERRAQLERERRTGLYRDNEAAYRAELDLLQRTKDAELAIYLRGYEKLQDANADFANGASRALENYLDSIKNVVATTDSLFTKSFSGLEDALVDFTKTGRLNFKSLAQGITDDLNRTIIRQNITGPLAEWLQGGLKTGEGVSGSIVGGIGTLLGDGKDKGAASATLGFQSLKTLGIDPATQALMRFTQAANGAGGPQSPQEFSLDGTFTGEGAVKGLFDEPSKELEGFNSTLVDARTGTQQLLDVFKYTSIGVGSLGSAGSAAAFALQTLPLIIQSMQGSSSGGGLGSFIGSLFGSANAAGGANAAGFGTGAGFGNMDFGGFLAGGGSAEAGKAYITSEFGRELFVPRQSGTVIPHEQTEKILRGDSPINQHFYVTGAVNKRTQGQVFAEAARGATMARARGTA